MKAIEAGFELAWSASEVARRVMQIEAEAISAVASRLDTQFDRACQLLLACHGRVIIMGMGKSGHVARKIAATMASTGTPAFFVHPGEAAHGDLGMITSADIVLALSNSGESDELVALLPSLKRLGVALVAMTGNLKSTLALESNVHLDVAVAEEACPLNLAPTASTTVALALGDALAVALLEARGFQAEDFALSHPGGTLGRRLLVHVRDLMHHGERLPVVQDDVPLRDALLEISRKGLGMTAVVNSSGELVGVYTDGDLRRTLDRDIDLRTTAVSAVMTPNPATIEASRLAAEAVQVMESRRINGLLVQDQGRLVGALNMHDLLRARVV
ncbi:MULTISPECIES: KpsF/GutQ family sugar-phosphate isomerase [Deefgea]|uniref:KpsF/GutQ family sugar-phosphate isomerase n=1 Tax=Deefgea chitinilytica TaxID=570276 RepID=A0ABS2C7C5_9NEIS|nr:MULTISPECIES: KpsF/GutQ family sugar-phosphate isomerase [Deefgea]MBM5570050.1 KpsF/GutQ family sugar-phosphate isomerase [Deefgea chitinilytica]MBM9887279.1 KpsF/GutQ family sugar-phosphate isomerase [Deefgea sp. CFH1-16]